MKILIAIDSFKGSLSSLEAGNIIKESILEVMEADVIVKPIADGGEGTTVALVRGLGGNLIDIEVTGPMHEKVRAKYGILYDNNTAVIEMAEASGLPLIPEDKRNPGITTTYGVGEMILDAFNKGCRKFIIGIGGSGTNDAGVGMLQALGYTFTDKDGNEVERGGIHLSSIVNVDDENVPKELLMCDFKIACDVTNPLYGENGATYIYGPQKGATKVMCDKLEAGIISYSNTVKSITGRDNSYLPGTGAAGGLGYAFVTFLNATLKSGIHIVLEQIAIEEEMKDVDIVITGEGRLDNQSVMGKSPIGVAEIAKKYGKTVIAFCGCYTESATVCNEFGIDAYFSIQTTPTTIEKAMEKNFSIYNLKSTVSQCFRLINSVFVNN